MLTKDDLKEISKLLKPLEQRITDLEIKVDESKNDLEISIFHLKAEVKEEFRQVKRQIKKIEDNQNIIIRHFVKEYQDLRKRVDHIEEKLPLSP